MAKKIYDFLPGHLKNRELETIFESTLDRAFSVGEMEKTKAFVGRKEKGIFKSSDIYLSFPPQSYARDNYGLEPTFSNRNATDNVFYDDLINALYNKGSLTNDHRRLFNSNNTLRTVALPIDLDKFVNFSMYYWVPSSFRADIFDGSDNKHYVTINNSTDMPHGTDNWWSKNNSWFHYDDIKAYIDDSNFEMIVQASRPIIEFDQHIELSTSSADKSLSDVTWELPTFKSYDNTGTTQLSDIKIFHYVVGDNYVTDAELGFKPKLKAGDYYSEMVFNIDLLETSTYKWENPSITTYKQLMVSTTFDYRNLRQEVGDKITVSEIELLQSPKNFNSIDLYVDGKKQIGNYTFDTVSKKITLTSEVAGNIYVDYCTSTAVVYDGDTVFQKINPSLEYNIDNNSYVNVELVYSTMHEHMSRIIETTSGLTGDANASNNYRNIGDTIEKLRHADKGSILVLNSIDIKEAYFALTREDYNPIKATEFLSNSYNGYKNKLLTTIIDKLSNSASDTKSDLQVLEDAIDTISLGKHSSVSIFRDSTMINFGENHSHYQQLDVNVIDGGPEQVMPTFRDSILHDKDVVIILNDVVQRLNVDYTLSSGATEIIFTTDRSSSDTITVRHYINIKENYIPPSATSLGIAPAHIPEIITDTEYETDVSFIKGHDGSLIPAYPLVDYGQGNGPETNRIDKILFIFETLVFNNLSDNTNSTIDSMNYGLFGTSTNDYSNAEKKYIMYPFFKKWMSRNSIDNLTNDAHDASDFKTWNYRAKDETASGNWRGQLIRAYGTDRPLLEPWKAIKLSQKPVDFDSTYGTDYTLVEFWNSLISKNSLTCPVPVDNLGKLLPPNELFFGNYTFTSDDIELMKQAWEFGDNSPVELAWTRSSEYVFAEFLLMLLTNPFEIIHKYKNELADIIEYSNKNEGIDNKTIIKEKENYSFKLGSKLGGFVNNFKLQTENNALSNSRFTELPEDNFDLFVHAGVPNRSEFFSAIVLEKVSTATKHPEYSLQTAKDSNYVAGTIVLNPNDSKYYKRKITEASAKELADPNVIVFDYSRWTLISQPKIDKFGFRVHGYDELNPVFYSMGWDKASGEKAFSTAGDKLTLKSWQSGEYYRMDSYTLWNDIPYVCLTSHTSSTDFDDNIKDWKPVAEWPTTNKIQAMGYQDLVDDTVKNYNYGDILETVDEVAHLIMGYEHYLKLVGWEFTDSNEFAEPVDWENLLYKFLEWQSENNSVGDFITLTPLLTGGNFNTDYGVASVATETFKNYYRIVDASGRLIPNSEVNFHTDGSKLTFTSNVPIYGMKMDIRDIEHAFVVDRTDSYGDVIYDPHSHNRNLRVQVDCNRTIDWDGTMSVDGFIVYDNKLLPNFDTMIAETNSYRDTLVDQSLSIVNKLKSNQYGYTTRDYLTNHGVERESQLEFYKGFLSHKGTVSSIDKIINNNSDFENITQSDIWAIKLSEYGHQSSKFTMTKEVLVDDMIQDPFLIEYQDTTKELLPVTKENNIAIKTTGYVNESDVSYTTSTYDSLTSLTETSLYEGDTAWIQADTDREWDVVRLSEVAELSYIGETSDNQLYIGTASEIDDESASKPIYIKISADEITPTISGYYLLSSNGTKSVNGTIVYEYLVFEEDFEPLTVEIDSTTSNSVFVPTSSNSGVEAIGSVSNPEFTDNETITIDGTEFTYTATGLTSSGITILGTVANPIVTEDEQASFVVYNSGGTVENGTSTTVTFTGTVAKTIGAFSSTYGDEIKIDDTLLTIDYSNTENISKTTTATRSSALTTDNTVVIDGITKTVEDLSVTGTVSSPVMSSTKPLTINGDTVTLTSGDDLTAIVNAINTVATEVVATQSSNQLVLTTSVPQLTMTGGSLIDLGLSTTNAYTDSKLDNLATDLTTITDITATVGADNRMTIASSGSQMVISGTALAELGITAGTYETNSPPTLDSVTAQINAIGVSGVSAQVITGTIKITSTNHNLDIVEVTSGAMSRLGYTTTTAHPGPGPETGNPMVAVDATDNIIVDLNNQVFQGSTVEAVKSDRQVKITSTEKSIVTSNISGNPLSDLGITAGTYSNATSSSPSALEFASQITAASDLVVGLSSDGRMIFTSDSVQMSFSGTSSSMLTRVGLVLTYSNVTSSANFKAMQWKSVRYTPGFNGSSRLEFETALGLNSASKLWIDNYSTAGWAVLSYSPATGTSIHARKATVIDTDLTKRLIVQDGENFINHQLYDPLNLKMPGQIVSKLDYIMWTDPAKYDTTTSNDLWLDEKLDTIWWDTEDARFYRYNDYGDANGNLDVDFVRKYWGKTVDSSNIIIRKWTKSRTLPVATTAYNTKTYYDTDAGKEITDYFFWSSTDSDAKNLAMLLASSAPKNRFLPVGKTSAIITNHSKSYDSSKITTSLEYQVTTGILKETSDWQLLIEDNDTPINPVVMDDMTDSISGVTIDNHMYDDKCRFKSTYATKFTTSDLADINFAVVTPVDANGNQFISGLTINDIVVTHDNKTVKSSYLTIEGSTLKISQNHKMTVGDVLRVYKISKTDNNWFTIEHKARENFASIINAVMSKELLQTKYSNHAQYIDTDDFIFSLGDWYIDDNYKTIKTFSYLSTTREFDMIGQYQNGIKSFKLKLPTHDEYYFEIDNRLQLVNRSKSSLNIELSSITYPETKTGGNFVIGEQYEILSVGTTDFTLIGADANSVGVTFTATGTGTGNGTVVEEYYKNAVGVQIQELMNLIRNHSETSFINNIFYRMIDYLYTEKSYPDWLFKTSYFDLNLHSRELKQHAVYQRDGETDILEYIRETKPYHTKIREVKRLNKTQDTAIVSTTIDENLNLTLDFGKASRYKKQGEVFDGGTTGNTPTNTTDKDIGSHGDLEAGDFLRNRTTATTVAGGIDTGQVGARAVESSVVVLQDYKDGSNDADISGSYVGTKWVPNLSGFTLDNTEFYVYDVYGRGYNVPIKDWGTLADTWTVSASSFVTGREYTIVSLGDDFFNAGEFVNGTEYTIKYKGTTDFTLIGATNNSIGTVFTATGVGSGTGLAQRSPTDFTLIGAADNNIGTVFTATGSGTGNGTARGRFKYTGLQGTAKTEELSASKKNKKLIAVQSISNPENVEFMMYDKNTGGELNIVERALYTTVGHNFSQNDRVFVLETPLALVLQDQK